MTRVWAGGLLRLSVAAVAAVVSANALADVLFLEDFETYLDGNGDPQPRCMGFGGAGTYPFPDGWLLRNVDNGTPDSAVAYVNAAWIVREDFAESSANCVAFSTSWYTPTAQADDWMWTPLISIPSVGATRLSWRAKAYDPDFPDGYEVRVMVAPNVPTGGTGLIGNQVTASDLIFSIGAENTAWTAREVDLSAYAGEGVYVAFRNHSNDKFLLVVDDIAVYSVLAHDPVIDALSDASGTLNYARIPAFLGYPRELAATVANNGSDALTQVQVSGQVLLDGSAVDAVASTPVSLAPTETAVVALGDAVYDMVGSWSVTATVTAAEGDDDLGNSTATQALVEVTDHELARWEGNNVGTLGIGANEGGEIGQVFDTPAVSMATGLRISMNNYDDLPTGAPDGIGDFNGYVMQATVRSWDTDADAPGDLVYTAEMTVPVDAPVGELELDFALPDLELPAGRYLVSLVEPTSPAPLTLALFLTENRYTPDTLWVNWPSSPFGGWASVEQFGISAFLHAAKIGLVLAPLRYSVGGTVEGLSGSGLVLQLNGDASLPIGANGSFVFPAIDDGSAYAVTVLTQPGDPAQTCTVANGSGVIDGADVTGIAVSCTTHQYAVGGTVTGLSGTGLVLQLNGGASLPIGANGSFAFPPVDDGSAYAVTVLTQPDDPAQTCTVANGSGVLDGADVDDVAVSCENDIDDTIFADGFDG